MVVCGCVWCFRRAAKTSHRTDVPTIELTVSIRWPISTKSCRPLMVDHPRSTMIGRLGMIDIQWPTIGHFCSTINGQPLLVNHLILNRYSLVGKGFLCMIFKQRETVQFDQHLLEQPFCASEDIWLGLCSPMLCLHNSDSMLENNRAGHSSSQKSTSH